MDFVAEGLNQAIEPRVQRMSARRMAAVNSLDGGFDFDEGGCREENGILMSSRASVEGWTLLALPAPGS